MVWFFLAIQPLFAGGVPVTATGCPCTGGSGAMLTFSVCNQTPGFENVMGFRFKTPSYGGWTGGGQGTWVTPTGSGPYLYEQDLASADQIIPGGHCVTSYSTGWDTLPTGQNGTPYDFQTLIKTGSCNSPVMEPTPTPIASCAAVAAVTATGNYYSTSCVAWEENGGRTPAGLSITSPVRPKSKSVFLRPIS